MSAVFLVLWQFIACADSDEPPSRIELDAVQAGGGVVVASKDLCDILEWGKDLRGLYRVVSITAYPQSDPVHTYVELEEVDAWLETSPERPVIRMPGGYSLEGERSYSSAPASFRVGETVIVFLKRPTDPENETYFWVTYQVIFHEITHGKYSNGILFRENGIAASELRSRVEELESNDGCQSSSGS